MPAKTNPVLGLVIGVIVGYAGVVGGSYAGFRMTMIRTANFGSIARDGMQWLLLLIVVAAVLGVLMAIRSIGAGVMTGVGLLVTVSSLTVVLLPLSRAFDLVKVFQVPGTDSMPYLVLDGSMLMLGVVLLVAGIGRWVSDAKANRMAGQGQLQDGDPAMFPQQAQQWGGYPGQQLPPR